MSQSSVVSGQQSAVTCESSLHRDETWFVNPADERVALRADLLAREKVHEYRAWCDQLVARVQLRKFYAGTDQRQASRRCADTGLVARQELRERMAMVMRPAVSPLRGYETIDRAGTSRSISAESVG